MKSRVNFLRIISVIIIWWGCGPTQSLYGELGYVYEAAEKGQFSFGSSPILQKCWTPKELVGKPTDRKIIFQKSPDHQVPARSAALHWLPILRDDRRLSVRYIQPDPGRKLAALTFDLCEKEGEITGYDSEIVNYLRQHQVKATFFAGGKWMLTHPEKTMQLMADPLFEIGNHSWNHPNMRSLKGNDLREQIEITQAQYELLREELQNRRCTIEAGIETMDLIPRLPSVFRFPYGACSAGSLEAVNRAGLAAIQWNIVTGDPAKSQSAASIAKTILNQIKPGAIIIAHANGRGWNTAEALPLFIPDLRRLGYEFVTVSELLNSGKVVSTDECYYVRKVDNSLYGGKFDKENRNIQFKFGEQAGADR